MRKKSKLSNILGVIGIILALIAILWGPKIYYFLWGDLKIDYKEDDVHVQDNKTYAKIEVINELGYSLEYVNGSVTLSCSGHDFQISSETFKLEGGYDFLAHGSKQTFLFSPDLFFVDLAKSCNVNCSDASWDNAKYLRTNNSHAELKEITSFEFFVDDSLKIVRKQHKPNEKILSKTCVNCDILIKIYAANIKQPFTKLAYSYIAYR